jgi:hypothetical protein
MNGSKMRFVVPILVIVAGITWLLNILEVIPGVDWVWTIGLGAVGVLMLVVGGLNKMTIVAGPFLIIAAVTSLLRQTGILEIDKEIPILTIALGSLLLVAQAARLELPQILKKEDETKE